MDIIMKAKSLVRGGRGNVPRMSAYGDRAFGEGK